MKGAALKAIFWYHHKIAQKALYKTDTAAPIWAWLVQAVKFFSTTYYESPEAVKKDKEFLRFYVTNSINICIQVLSVNIVLLLIALYIILQKHFGVFHIMLDPTFKQYESAYVEIIIWIVFSLLCLGYFLILHHWPSFFQKYLLSEDSEVWYEIGAAILFSRLLILIVQLVYLANSPYSCYDTVDILNNQDGTFGYMFIQMSIEVYETYTFASLPFPQPWAAGFTLIGLIKQEIRLFSCESRLHRNQEEEWIVQLVALVLALMYVTIIWLPAWYLEISFRNWYKSTQLQRNADEAKREMVGFLCTGVRVPLQYLLHSVHTVDFLQISGENVAPLLADIHQYTRMVNEIADDLLLLVRIRENRYTSKPVLVHNLQTVLDAAVLGVLQRHPTRGTSSLDCFVDINVPDLSGSSVSVDEKCLLSVVKHLLIFITQERSNYTDSSEITPNNMASTSVTGTYEGYHEINRRVELTLTVTIESSSEAPLSTQCPEASQQLVLTLTGDSSETSDWGEARGVHEATTVYVCRSIAVSCGGQFRAKPLHYELTLPCMRRTTEPAAQSPPQSPQRDGARAQFNDAGDVVHELPQSPESPQSPQLPQSPGDDETVNVGSVWSTHKSQRDNKSHKSAATRALNELRTSEKEKHSLSEKMQRIELSLELQTRFKRSRVCVIAEDSVLENVITDVLRRVRLDDNMSVLHEIQKGQYVPAAKLTFVTSYQVCMELRQRKYPGRIVLFSGSINYLDDAQIANVDYCLPLPAGDTQLSLFMDWLIELHASESRMRSRKNSINKNLNYPNNNTVSRTNGIVRRPSVGRRPSGFNAQHAHLLSASNSNNSSVEQARPIRKRTFFSNLWNFFVLAFAPLRRLLRAIHKVVWRKDKFYMVPAIAPELVESYYKWKLLNPARSWYHSSIEVYFTAGPRMLMALFVETILFKQKYTSLVPAVIIAMCYMSKGVVYKYILKPCGFSLLAYWTIPAILANGYFVISAFQVAFEVPPRADHQLSLTEFLTARVPGGTTGAQALYGIILTGSYSRLYGWYLAHPSNLTQNLFVFIHSTVLIWQVFRLLLSWQWCLFLQLLCVQITALNLIYMTHVESSNRREFKAAHDHILAKAFLDHCLDICQQDIRKPLQSLLGKKNDLMKVMMHSTYSRAIVVDRALISKLEPLQMSHWMMTEMVTGFALSHYMNERHEHLQIRNTIETVQLNRAVAEILSGMASTAEDSHIQIFSEIDNKLAVVRMDWKIFSMVLINLVSTALRNIRDFCIENPRNKDITNYIKIKIVSINSDAKLPFVHPRLLLVNVCDSSNAAAKLTAPAHRAASTHKNLTELGQKDVHSLSDIAEQSDRVASRYGHSLCEKIVKRVCSTPVFETITAEAQYSTVQRFTFHYHLTPQTRRAQEYVDVEAARDYLTVMVCPAEYFTNYDRIIRPSVRSVTLRSGVTQRIPGVKQMVYLSGAEPEKRNETISLVRRLETFGWACTVKYVLKVPAMTTIGAADCVMIDQQLELVEGVNISDTVLKLRVCGYNGIIVVVLKEGGRNTELIKDELARSAADIDLLLPAPVRDSNIQAITVALEKKSVRQLLYMNGN